jgi:hypothetical protein
MSGSKRLVISILPRKSSGKYKGLSICKTGDVTIFKISFSLILKTMSNVLLFQYGRVRTGFGKSWKVLEIDNGFFQDLDSFGKLIFGPLGYGKVMDFL